MCLCIRVCNIFKFLKNVVLFIVFIHYTFQLSIAIDGDVPELRSLMWTYPVLARHLVAAQNTILSLGDSIQKLAPNNFSVAGQ